MLSSPEEREEISSAPPPPFGRGRSSYFLPPSQREGGRLRGGMGNKTKILFLIQVKGKS